VAHSFGSLIARAFCAQHPERTAGLVLLDPIDCEHWRALPVEDKSELALAERFARRGVWLAHLGVIRFALLLLSGGARTLPKGIARVTSGKAAGVISRITGEVGKMPPEIWPAVRSHWSRPQSFRTLAEYFAALSACVRQAGYKTLGDIPITVISAANASPPELAEHRKLAGLSTQGEHIVAENSGHWIHLDRPDLVIAAVQRCHPQRWRSAG
jgi:pimeloyl-ACP methyl ester carboxylesterase